MISEAQKHIIFNINCFYQLVGQKDKFENGLDIEMLPEVAILAIHESEQSNSINWAKIFAYRISELQSFGLSRVWLDQLAQSVNDFVERTGDIQQFRNKFLISIDLLLNMVNAIASNAPQVPTDDIAQLVVGDIFDKDYWEGETANQIRTVRVLETELGLSKVWSIEFSQAFLKKLK